MHLPHATSTYMHVHVRTPPPCMHACMPHPHPPVYWKPLFAKYAAGAAGAADGGASSAAASSDGDRVTGLLVHYGDCVMHVLEVCGGRGGGSWVGLGWVALGWDA